MSPLEAFLDLLGLVINCNEPLGLVSSTPLDSLYCCIVHENVQFIEHIYFSKNNFMGISMGEYWVNNSNVLYQIESKRDKCSVAGLHYNEHKSFHKRI